MPYPVRVKWDDGEVYLKSGNAIIVVDNKGDEINISSQSLKNILRRKLP